MLEGDSILRMAAMHHMGDRVPSNLTKNQTHVAFVVFSDIEILHNVCREQSGRHPLPCTIVIQVKYSRSFILSTKSIFENTCHAFHFNHLLKNNLDEHDELGTSSEKLVEHICAC